MTAALEVARSAADGYTVGLCVSTHASLAAISKKLPYDTERDFAPVVFIGSIPLVLIVSQKSLLQDAARASRRRQGKAGLAELRVSRGRTLASIRRRASEAARQRRNSGDLLSRNGACAERRHRRRSRDDVRDATGRDGRDRRAELSAPLAITAPQRAESLPDVPTVAELGFPGFDVSEWFGIVAPGAHATSRRRAPQRGDERPAARSRAAALAEAEQCRARHDHARRIPATHFRRNQEAVADRRESRHQRRIEGSSAVPADVRQADRKHDGASSRSYRHRYPCRHDPARGRSRP